jgi:1,4-alpha-glucan branching enzyme
LYGHWWFEGPAFIEHFFRALNHMEAIEPITPPNFIENKLKSVQIDTPGDSTWGANGYNEVWLNGSNDWIYKHLDHLIEKMGELANLYKDTEDELKIRALNQAARELLLAQSSDWAFIMTTGTTVEYASNRTKQHVDRFLKLYNEITNDTINKEDLEKVEWLDPIFKDIDYKVYCTQ